jgi:hypothetical protein
MVKINLSLDILVGILTKRKESTDVQLGFINKSKPAIVEASRDYVKDNNGAQIGLYNEALNTRGAQLGLINRSIDSCVGYQGSVLYNGSPDLKGVQTGSFNIAEYLKGLQMGWLNLVIHDMTGVQIGILNSVGLDSTYYDKRHKATGVQVGLANANSVSFNGIQFGFLNLAKQGNYFQIGVINIRETGPWYTRITPLVGYHSEPEKIRKK